MGTGTLELVTLVVVLFVITDWIAVALLAQAAFRARRNGEAVPALEERGSVATAIAIASTIIALLGINRLLGLPVVGDILIFALVAAVLLPSLANARWLFELITGRFD